MSEKLMRMEHNLTTGEISYIELTDEEQAIHEATAKTALELQQAQEAADQKARDEAAALPQTVTAMQAEIKALKELVTKLTSK